MENIFISLIDKDKQPKSVINNMINDLCEEIFHSFDEIFEYINQLTVDNERVVTYYKYNTNFEKTPLTEIPLEKRSVEITFKLKDYTKKVELNFDSDSEVNYKEIEVPGQDEENEIYKLIDKEKTFLKLKK